MKSTENHDDTNEPPAAPQPTETPVPDPAADPTQSLALDPGADHDTEPLPEPDVGPPPGVRTMAIVRWALVALMAGAALFALNAYYGWFEIGAGAGGSETTYFCSMHPGIQQDHPGDCPICSMSLVPMPETGEPAPATSSGGEGAIPPQRATDADGNELYYCPMHTEVTSTDPDATCSQCGGMQLEPMPAAAATPPAGTAAPPGLVAVTLSPERVQLMGMTTARATRESLSSELRTVGVVAASEKGYAVIQTRFAGWIEELYVEQTGQKIKKGAAVATIYSPELLTAQQEYLNALRWAEETASVDAGAGTATGGSPHPKRIDLDLREDARRRLELLGISAREIAQIEKTGKPIRAIPVRSPVTGYVVQKDVVQGAYVQPGTSLVQVADLSTVWVTADVYEHDVGRVKEGQTAKLTFSAYPGEEFTGKVSFLYPNLNTSTRTMRARLDLENPGMKLKPGMYADVYLSLARDEGLVIPIEALVDNGEVQYVFVSKPEGRFEPRQVKVGRRSGAKVQILDGIAEGELVVTTANFLLDSESQLQATILGDTTAASDGGVPAPTDACSTDFDAQKYPDKHQQCVACRAMRGMGSMEADCRTAIPRPWK